MVFIAPENAAKCSFQTSERYNVSPRPTGHEIRDGLRAHVSQARGASDPVLRNRRSESPSDASEQVRLWGRAGSQDSGRPGATAEVVSGQAFVRSSTGHARTVVRATRCIRLRTFVRCLLLWTDADSGVGTWT
jgi:hypothetical protein